MNVDHLTLTAMMDLCLVVMVRHQLEQKIRSAKYKIAVKMEAIEVQAQLILTARILIVVNTVLFVLRIYRNHLVPHHHYHLRSDVYCQKVTLNMVY